jgi:hypothetical protein
MPKTAVHENRDSAFCEYKIRTPEKAYVTPPPNDSVAAKKCNESQFGGLIAPPADTRHDLRSLGHRKNVSHAAHQFQENTFIVSDRPFTPPKESHIRGARSDEA